MKESNNHTVIRNANQVGCDRVGCDRALRTPLKPLVTFPLSFQTYPFVISNEVKYFKFSLVFQLPNNWQWRKN